MWNTSFMLVTSLSLAAAIIVTAGTTNAQSSSAPLCDQAARRAANETGVPLDVMRAITRTETGRTKGGTLQPWPWTVNMEGAGHWFDSQSAAEIFTERHFLRGSRSFDVGCFQLNYRWHHMGFSSLNAMFDPNENALYAANFLSDLYSEFGDWSVAAGAYHSRTPKYANRYRQRFEKIYASLKGAPPEAPAPVVTRSTNSALDGLFFSVSVPAGPGSLVPTTKR